MPRTVNKTLTFPLAGVVRREGYREQTRPYSAPWAANVRGRDPLESRQRGGSRPGLEKASVTDIGNDITTMVPLTSVDLSGARQYDLVIISDGVFYQLAGGVVSNEDGAIAIDGDNLAIDGDDIIWPVSIDPTSPIGDTDAYYAAARAGKLYVADAALREFVPESGTVTPVVATAGTVPVDQPVICNYRDRIILTGENHIWYACRQGDPTDWDYGADAGDEGKAIAGQLAHAGMIGDTPKAAVPVEDKALVFGCANSLWVLQGDPATGRVERINSEIGIIAPNAWAMTGGNTMAFLSRDGVYLWAAGTNAAPARFSEERTPDELRDVDPTANFISMAYDETGRGFHLYITPTGASTGVHWWFDIENKAMWPVYLAEDHEPRAIARMEGDGLGEILLGCSDGYIRKYNASASDDDGTDIESHILIGPVRLSPNDVQDALLAEIHGILANVSGDVTWRVMMGSSAETVVDAAVAGVAAVQAGGTPAGVAAEGTWTDERNKVVRPRSRGAWTVIWISATTKWAYEAVAIVARQLGRLR